MALISCPECGKEISDQAVACPNCGFAVTNIKTEDANRCPKCGDSTISYQREQSANIGGGLHSFNKKAGHGCLYYLLFAWWIWIFRLVFGLLKIGLTGGLCLFFRKKKNLGGGYTVSANKSINHTVAVCQKCGYSWKI